MASDTPERMKDVIERIRKVANLADGKGSTEAEAMVAAEKMRALMDRYRLSMTDIEITRESVVTELVDRPTRVQHGPLDRVMTV